MTTDEMLKLATRFQISEDITVEKRGENKWAIVVFGQTVLDNNMERHYEPLPSNRSEEFIQSTRFTLTDAFNIAFKYMENNYETIE